MVGKRPHRHCLRPGRLPIQVLEKGFFSGLLVLAHPADLEDDGIVCIRAGVGGRVRIVQPGEVGAEAHSEHFGQEAVEGVDADLALDGDAVETTSSPTSCPAVQQPSWLITLATTV